MPPIPTPVAEPEPPSAPSQDDALGEYFDALAAAASTNQNVLLELVASNTRLTKANEALQASITLLTKNNEALVAKLARSGIANTANPNPTPVKAKKLCPHCKRLVMHLPDDCFELEKNKGRRRWGWVSVL